MLMPVYTSTNYGALSPDYASHGRNSPKEAIEKERKRLERFEHENHDLSSNDSKK